MPPIDDCDPVQDLKVARESASMADQKNAALGSLLDSFLLAAGGCHQAYVDRLAADERERTARYKRDQLSGQLATALIAAGCSPSKLVRCGPCVLRFNDAGHGQYWVELLEAQTVSV